MSELTLALSALEKRFPNLEPISELVFRVEEEFGGAPYAVRYFDLRGNIIRAAETIEEDQERLLSKSYFSTNSPVDLRWSHYLYLVTTDNEFEELEVQKAKAKIERDRNYARKLVVSQSELASLLDNKAGELPATMPVDLATAWQNKLKQYELAFVLDTALSVPEVVRRIAGGHKDAEVKAFAARPLSEGEVAASSEFIRTLSIKDFREYPAKREYEFGKVNLITGSNGVGKTSLLEAIEFLYCGSHRRHRLRSHKAAVHATLGESNTGFDSTVSPERLRSRHGKWYGKTELKTVNIADTFGKFNFLNTDAATELSVEDSAERIGGDVARLILGVEAENIRDRLVRVRTELLDRIRESDSNRASIAKTVSDLKARAVEIESKPRKSNKLLAELNDALNDARWQGLWGAASDVSELRDRLQVALKNTKIVMLVELGESKITESILAQKLEAAMSLTSRANDAVKQLDVVTSAAAPLQSALESWSRRRDAMDHLGIYVASGFQEVLILEQTVINELRLLEPFAMEVPLALPVGMDRYSNLLLSEAVITIGDKCAECETELESARTLVSDYELRLERSTALKEQLLSAARQVVSESKDVDHCPVCKTQFDELALQKIISGAIDTSSNGVDSASLYDSVAKAELELESMRRIQDFAFRVQKAAPLDNGDVTISAKLHKISQLIAKQNELTRQLAFVQGEISDRASKGQSKDDLLSTLAQAGLDVLPSANEYKDIVQALDTNASFRQGVEEKVAEISRAKTELAEIRVIAGASETGDTKMLLRQLSEQERRLEDAVEAYKSLAASLGVDELENPQNIRKQLELVSDLALQLMTAVEVEKIEAGAVGDSGQFLKKEEELLTAVNAEVRRLRQADSLLNEVMTDDSPTELTNQILTENIHRIDQVFSAIHFPNEFDIRANEGKLEVVRRSTGEKAELFTMSTGQRAAYALSLFLAMNGRLNPGPPLLLLDDPVANVDDINSLAFLDHLRDVAMSGARQVFFATADSKLAALFRHKFSFLGEKDFKEIPLCRD